MKVQTWWALRVNGNIEDLKPTKEALFEAFDTYGLIEVKDLKKGPVTIDVVPVKIVVERMEKSA